MITKSSLYQVSASALAIAAVTLIIYFPSLRVGFLGDDWWFLGKAATLSLPDYLAFYFDPAQQIFWYRPLYGIFLGVEYFFFRAAPEGYHAGQILLHLSNTLLFFSLIRRISGRARLALVAALFYATVALHSSAVFWIAVQDPLALFFSLAAVWFWLDYLQTRNARAYVLTLTTFVLAVLGKETAILLPGILFLVDRLLIADDISFQKLSARYAFLALVFLVLLLIEYQVQSNAYFPNRWGYQIGWHVIENGARYLALIAFPWGLSAPLNFAWLIASMAVILILAASGYWRIFLFLFALALAAILPALFFPTTFFFPRYLYAATISSAILFAMLIEWLCTPNFRALSRPFALFASSRVFRVAFALFAGLLLLWNSAQTYATGVDAAEEGRQMRIPLRDIYQQHPTFPSGTYLYFVDFPYPYILRNLTGMVALRYGSAVSVWSTDAEFGGADENRFADLRARKNAWVYALDENQQRREIAVQPGATFRATLSLPASMQAPIRLEGFEATGATLKRGDDLALLLYWKATGGIDKDYTVFVHLVNERGETIFGEDTQPRGGRAPTSKWSPGKLVVDAHILNIPLDAPPGNYRAEIGLYYLPTLERVSFVDGSGAPMADQIVIELFKVTE